MNIRYYFRIILLGVCLAMSLGMQAQLKKKFTLVLDPGHGGKDPGASSKKAQEKNIVLAVALMLGEKIERTMADVDVLYTRDKDVYPTLRDRSAFANKNHADLFISIHVNAVDNRAVNGAETFLLGVDKMGANLNVAMKENAVMLLEDDYKSNYEGFNPNSVESYIMFEFMQNQHMENSVQLASLTQNQLIGSCKRKDRGVKQAPFWVLYSVGCPSILVELGFISNAADEAYMTSKKGQMELADGLYRAFASYKKSLDTNAQVEIVTQSAQNETYSASEQTGKPVYKVQILSGREELRSRDRSFKGVRDVDYYQESGMYKYTVGEETDFDKINKVRMELKDKFPGAFVVAFLNGEKISVTEAKKL